MKIVFTNLLMMSLAASLLMLLIFALRPLLKKAPKKYSYFLWIIPYARMIIPTFFVSSFSLFYITRPINNQIDEVINTPTQQIAAETVTTASDISALDVISYVWAAVAGILLIAGLIKYISFNLKLKKARYVCENIYEIGGIESPFTAGVFKKRIYVPSGMSLQELEPAIVHEQVHMRRQDNLVKGLALITTCVHWFNPLAWISFKLMCTDMEMSCDEAAIKRTDKKQYAVSLMKFASSNRSSGVIASFAAPVIKNRIKNLCINKKSTIIKSAVLVVLCAGLCAVCLTNPGSTGTSANNDGGKPVVAAKVTEEPKTTEEPVVTEKPVTEETKEKIPEEEKTGTESVIVVKENKEKPVENIKKPTPTPAKATPYPTKVPNPYATATPTDGYQHQPSRTPAPTPYWTPNFDWCGVVSTPHPTESRPTMAPNPDLITPEPVITW